MGYKPSRILSVDDEKVTVKLLRTTFEQGFPIVGLNDRDFGAGARKAAPA